MEVDEEESEEVLMCCSNNTDLQFDKTVGYIEDIVIEDNLTQMLQDFLDRHYEIFDENEENKLEYMLIFQEYHQVIEKYIEEELIKRQPGFQMSQFIEQILQREDDLENEIFHILLSFTDFQIFKEIMLDYKKAKLMLLPKLNEDLVITSFAKLNFSH